LEYPLLSREWVKLRTSNLAGIFTGSIRTKSPSKFGRKRVWVYPETAKIFGVPPIIAGMQKATNFKFGRYIHMVHPSKSPLKFLEKRERGPIQGLPNFFRVPPIISGTCKATNFKFGRYIQSIHANKSPLKIWEKRERGHIQGLPKFLEYPLLSQVHSEGLCEQKPMKYYGEKGAWVYPETGHFLNTPCYLRNS